MPPPPPEILDLKLFLKKYAYQGVLYFYSVHLIAIA